ncbi:UvrD-helicase domain-containing protein [Clostridium thermopalmarium]|nr:UvrD-helicase domain-containing protein [Clostridium thermopalmarium]
MGCDLHFDDARISIIKNLESTDIQAFPGSGKTTTLVAKLAILAKKWPYANSGICVLSHTNVAREEIEEKLGNTDVGKKLLMYPHFIGTLHSFFDTYVSLPWLHSKGLNLNIIDSDIVINSRWNMIPNNIRAYLTRQYKDEKICSYQGSIGCIDWDKQGDTREKLLTVIQKSQNNGNFTFDEMLLYAKQALDECDSFAVGIQRRFPIVFIDEAQDTNSFQWELLHKAFPADGSLTIRQGFGDSNQAIYNYINEVVDKPEFPRENPLVLSESRRFDHRIAVLANTVAISSEQMKGTDNEFSERGECHTLYLFSKDKAWQVIDEFGQLILNTFSDDELLKYRKVGCHVIGMVHDKKEDTHERHFPKGIYDYWPCYEAKKANKSITPRNMLGYFRKGVGEFLETGETSGQVEWISKGIRRLLNKAQKENFVFATNSTFRSIIKLLPEDKQMIFRKLMAELTSIDVLSEENWKNISEMFLKILKLFNLTANQNVQKFLAWSDDENTESKGNTSDKVLPNHYVFYNSETERSVDLEFGSIHSVKGRTHLATLVLETYSKSHNLKAILKYLCNTPPKSIGSNQNRLKCQYVAMTRARALLCLAIPLDFVDENTQDKLKKIGWNLRIVE